MENKMELLAFLEEAKTKKAELIKLEEETDAKEIEYKKAAKSLKNETKAVEDSVEMTIKKRKGELTKSFDAELDRVEALVKETKESRLSAKEKGQDERFKNESLGVRTEIRNLKTELNTLFKKNNIPSICDTKLFYALTSPKGVKEILIAVLAVLICFVAIPLITYAIVGGSALSLVLIYLICIVVFGGLYFIFFLKQKQDNGDILDEGRQIRNRIEACEKQVSAIKKSIKDDSNEEMYNLGEFDSKLADLNTEKGKILDKKNAAIAEFENQTAKQIEEEITANSKERLDLLGETASKAKFEYDGLQESLQGLKLDMASKFETVLGKNYEEEELDRYAEYIEKDMAANISEAQELYKLNAPTDFDESEIELEESEDGIEDETEDSVEVPSKDENV